MRWFGFIRERGAGRGRSRCASVAPIALDRDSVNRRIRETPAIRRSLERIAVDEDLGIALFRCAACGQTWQSGREWNFANREYLFQVPAIEPPEWQEEHFKQPAAMMIYPR